MASFVPSEPTSRLGDPRDGGGVLAISPPGQVQAVLGPSRQGQSKPVMLGLPAVWHSNRNACPCGSLSPMSPSWCKIRILEESFISCPRTLMPSPNRAKRWRVVPVALQQPPLPRPPRRLEVVADRSSTPLTACRRSNSYRVRAESQSG